MYMNVQKYLFFIEDGYIITLYYNENTDVLSIETNKGEKKFLITDSFWEWWERTASFTKKNELVDFCFIYDKPNFIIDHEYQTCEKSTWNHDKIKMAINILEKKDIVLKSINKEIDDVYIDINKSSEKTKYFYIDNISENIELDMSESESYSIISSPKINFDGATPFAKMFKSKLEKERQERM